MDVSKREGKEANGPLEFQNADVTTFCPADNPNIFRSRLWGSQLLVENSEIINKDSFLHQIFTLSFFKHLHYQSSDVRLFNLSSTKLAPNEIKQNSVTIG